MADLSRRSSLKLLAAGVGITVFGKNYSAHGKKKRIRLGGPIFDPWTTPEQWAEIHRRLGYAAALCPLQADEGEERVQAFVQAARQWDITIAEVGAWSNPLSPDSAERAAAVRKCQEQLALAERIGARCCVNISGSRGTQWDGPHPLNLTGETFEMIVQTTRTIIDAVKPTATFFTLETMPWAFPDSPEAYVRLITAVNRKAFAVHLDPANLICSPQRYFANGELIRECFAKLGPYIKSCHAKDVLLSPKMTTHLDEVRVGMGGIDYAVFLKELSRFPDVPLILEHLKTAEEYKLAADHLRRVAAQINVDIS